MVFTKSSCRGRRPEKQTRSRLAPFAVMVLWLASFLQSALAAEKPATPSRPNPKTSSGDASYRVEIVRNLAYRKGDQADPIRHKLDLYLPHGQRGFPVVLFIHGGSWKSGSKDEYPKLGEFFAQKGVGCVIPNYRLTPKVQHPAHVQDIAAAFAWVCENIESYGGRRDRVFLFGHSAGGHLAALLATDDKYLREHGRGIAEIRGVIAMSGVHQIYPAIPIFRKAFGPGLDEHRDASPIHHVRNGCPPFLLLYAENDLPFLARMAEEMNQALKKHGCDSACVRVPERNHISILVKLVEEGDLAQARIVEFLARYSEWNPARGDATQNRSNR